MKKIAIVLSGCGNRDGSELQETLSLMLSIDRRGWTYQCFAPYGELQAVSYTEKTCHEFRKIYDESARIARGSLRPLHEYEAADFDALALPGGMGAARNLSTYAFDGIGMKVNDSVERAIRNTYDAQKPILAMCIAPILLAKVLGSEGVRLTFGKPCAAAENATLMGAVVCDCEATDICVDSLHHVYTTPAYMVGTHISQIFDGADKLVATLM